MASQNIINSATATAIAEIVTLPICTIKTRYQNTQSNSIQQTIKSIYRTSGIKAFYAASVPAISSQVLSTSSKYVLYRHFEDQHFSYSNKMFNGMISGIMSSLITHPIDSIKIHFQMNTSFMAQLKQHGIGLFYRGYSKTFSKTALGSSLFFPLYDYSNSLFNNPFYASFCSAVISTSIIHPLDYLKTRHIFGLPLYQGYNPITYYKGLTLNLLRVVPHFMIVMTTIDYLKLR